jgi:hypothetical protein
MICLEKGHGEAELVRVLDDAQPPALHGVALLVAVAIPRVALAAPRHLWHLYDAHDEQRAARQRRGQACAREASTPSVDAPAG